MKLKRFELRSDDAAMVEGDAGEWCAADDVEKLEAKLADAVVLINTLISADPNIRPSLFDECNLFILDLDS